MPDGVARVGHRPEDRAGVEAGGETVRRWPSDHAGLVGAFETTAPWSATGTGTVGDPPRRRRPARQARTGPTVWGRGLSPRRPKSGAGTPSTRTLVASLLAGVFHATALLAVALVLGYEVGPPEYSPVGVGWRYGGLVVVATVPVWLAMRYRLVAPVLALVLTTGYVLGTELAPPGPTFRDVAELEGLAEPTGIIFVEDGLYVVRYMVNASVWTVGFLFVGLLEYAARTLWNWLPDVSRPIPWLPVPAPKRRGLVAASVGGLLHATVMVWFAHRLGVTVSGGVGALLYLFGAVGTWLLAAVPIYLLVRHRLVAPATLLTVFVLLDVRAEFTASAEDPHALYFGGWFLLLGILLVAAGIEYGLRRAGGHRWPGSLS